MTLRFQSGGTLPFAEYLPFTGGDSTSDANVPLADGGKGSGSADDM
jgi:hypothetical protein